MMNSLINIDILYHISSFCDFATQLNIKKLCTVTNNSYKIQPMDPIYPFRKEFMVKYNNNIIGSIYTTNTQIDSVIKTIISICDFISGAYKINDEITFDIILPSGKKRNYICIYINHKIEITVDHEKKFIYPDCLTISKRQCFTAYDKGIFRGKYYGTPYSVAKKICANLFKDGRIAGNFSFMRISDGKCFYYTGEKTLLSSVIQVRLRNRPVVFSHEYKTKERKIEYSIRMGHHCPNNNPRLYTNKLDEMLRYSPII